MNNIVNMPYFNHRDWILYHCADLGLSNEELLCVLLIDFANEKGMNVSYSFLSKSLNKSEEEIDEIFKSLSAKAVLQISLNDMKVCYNIDALFNPDIVQSISINDSDLFDDFAEVFARPLTTSEKGKLADFRREYSDSIILAALRMADSYGKYSMAYIEGILKHNDEKSGQ